MFELRPVAEQHFRKQGSVRGIVRFYGGALVYQKLSILGLLSRYRVQYYDR